MSDYLEIEYASTKRPQTDYPAKLAERIYKDFDFKPGMSILEFGCGRAELLAHFKVLGMLTYAVDDAPSSAKFAEAAGASFQLFTFRGKESMETLSNQSYDVIFSKSFVEHLSNPIEFAIGSFQLLKPGGLFINLTPDWESNKDIFFDDLTHVKPFTMISMQQLLDYGHFETVRIERFRQLPITWKSNFFNLMALVSSYFASPRAKRKWWRWSRELMIIGVGRKPMVEDCD